MRSHALHSHAARNGVVIATEKKTTSALVDITTLDKVASISKNIGLVYSGMGADARVLVNKARKSVQKYKRVYGEEPPTAVMVREIAAVMQEFTQSGCASDCLNCGLTDGVVVCVRLACRCWSLGTTRMPAPCSTRSIRPAVILRGRPRPLART